MAGKLKPLALILQGVDRASDMVDRISKKVDKVNAPVNALRKSFGGLGKSLNLGPVGAALSNVGEEFAKLARSAVALTGIIGGLAIAGMRWFVGFADEIGGTAERLDVTTEALQRMRYAGELLDVSQQDVDAGLTKLSRNLGVAARKNGPMRGLLLSMGVDARKIKDPIAAITIMAEKLQGVPKAQQLDKLGRALGGAGAAWVNAFAAGPDKLRELLAEAGTVGNIIKDPQIAAAGELDNELKRLRFSVVGLGTAIAADLVPDVTAIVKVIREWVVEHRGVLKDEVLKRVHQFGSFLSETVPKVLEMIDAIGGWRTVAIGVAAVIAGPLLAAIAQVGIALALAGPIGWAIAGILALGALGTWLYAKFEPVRKTVEWLLWALQFVPIIGQAMQIASAVKGYVASREPADYSGMSMAGGATAVPGGPGSSAGDASANAQQFLAKIGIQLGLPKGATGQVTRMQTSGSDVSLDLGMSMVPGY